MDERRPGRPGPHPLKVALILAVGLGSILLTVAVAVKLATPVYKLPTPPDPNGFDDLLAAARQAGGGPFANLDPVEAPEPELARAVAQEQEALALLRRGLRRESLIPLRFDPTDIPAAVDRSGPVRSLGRLLRAEGRLAESRREPGLAARSYLDAVRLGAVWGRGGLLIDALVGYAIEAGYGTFPLAKLADAIPSEGVPDVIASLIESDRLSEPFDEAARREMAYARGAHGLWMGLWVNLFGILKEHLERSIEAAREPARRTEASRRLLILELALRLHRERHGRDPDRLEGLVPEFLPAIPPDPYRAEGWIYRPRPDGPARLYSVGPDGRDDDGRPLVLRRPDEGGDLSIEVMRGP